MVRVQEGDTVTVIYQGILEDGSVFDSTGEEEPLIFVIGEDSVLPGFEKALLGMEAGEQKTVTVTAEEGFGLHLDTLVDDLPREELPAEFKPQIGAQLEVTVEDGSTFDAIITAIGPDRVTLDANHPLAGHTLIFHIELLAVTRPTIN